MKFDIGNNKPQQLEAGTYQARIVGVIDIGTQRSEFDGKERFSRQLVLQFEFPTETFTNDEGQTIARTLGKFYTASLNEKASLRKHLEQVRGKKFTQEDLAGFDVKKLLGALATVSVVLNQNDKPKVANVSAPMKGANPPQVNPSLYFDLDAFEASVYETLPEFYKAIIADSPEYIRATQKVDIAAIHEELGNLF